LVRHTEFRGKVQMLRNNPYDMPTLSAQPANVDPVMVNGKLLKSKGKLTSVDVPELLDEVGTSLRELQQRAKALE
jgi:hypothetical protein